MLSLSYAEWSPPSDVAVRVQNLQVLVKRLLLRYSCDYLPLSEPHHLHYLLYLQRIVFMLAYILEVLTNKAHVSYTSLVIDQKLVR